MKQNNKIKIKKRILKLNWKLKNSNKCPYTIMYNISNLRQQLNK